jgi:hypothetical protein
VVNSIVSNKRRDSLVGDQLGIGTKKKTKTNTLNNVGHYMYTCILKKKRLEKSRDAQTTLSCLMIAVFIELYSWCCLRSGFKAARKENDV